jgi:hypothetical protein
MPFCCFFISSHLSACNTEVGFDEIVLIVDQKRCPLPLLFGVLTSTNSAELVVHGEEFEEANADVDVSAESRKFAWRFLFSESDEREVFHASLVKAANQASARQLIMREVVRRKLGS